MASHDELSTESSEPSLASSSTSTRSESSSDARSEFLTYLESRSLDITRGLGPDSPLGHALWDYYSTRPAQATPPSSNFPGAMTTAIPSSGRYKRTPSSTAAAGQPTKRTFTARPTCTHVSMVKVYFDRADPLQCEQCTRIPDLGFLYRCEQDVTHPQTPIPPLLAASTPKDGKSSKKFFSSKRPQSFEAFGPEVLSESIQAAIFRGEYTSDQVDKLIAQKIHVTTLAAEQYAEAEELKSKMSSPAKMINQKLAEYHLADKEKSKDTPKPSKTNKPRRVSITRSIAACNYMVCHSCRPNSRDKTFISFEDVFTGKVQLPIEHDPMTMPVHHPRLVGNLGLRKPPEAGPTFTPTSSGSDESEQAVTPITASNVGGNAGTNFGPAMLPGGMHRINQPGAFSFDPLLAMRPSTWSPHGASVFSQSPEKYCADLRNSLLSIVQAQPPHHSANIPAVESMGARGDMGFMSAAVEQAQATAEMASDISDAPTKEQDEVLNSQISVLSDMCYNEDGVFDARKWLIMSDEVLAKAAELQLGGEGPSNTSTSGNNEGVDREDLERKLQELKGKQPQEGAGLGIKLTEEAVENDAPDFVVEQKQDSEGKP